MQYQFSTRGETSCDYGAPYLHGSTEEDEYLHETRDEFRWIEGGTRTRTTPSPRTGEMTGDETPKDEILYGNTRAKNFVIRHINSVLYKEPENIFVGIVNFVIAMCSSTGA